MFSFNTKNRKYTHNKSSHDKAKKSIGNSDVIGDPSRLKIGTQKVPWVPPSCSRTQTIAFLKVLSRLSWTLAKSEKNGTFGKIVDVWKFGFSRFFAVFSIKTIKKNSIDVNFAQFHIERSIRVRLTLPHEYPVNDLQKQISIETLNSLDIKLISSSQTIIFSLSILFWFASVCHQINSMCVTLNLCPLLSICALIMVVHHI